MVGQRVTMSARVLTWRLPALVRRYSTSASGPLAGVRVLDMTRVLAGPYCTMQLADMGAEVIKVEKIDGGDDTRSWQPPAVNGESAYFLCVNRNKRSIAVDFTKPEGCAVLHDLAAISDVFVENFIPGNLKKYGLDYETLRAINPRLVYCSITGYGPDGPYARRPGYDVIVCAIGGMLHATGPEGGDPCKPGVALTDLMTGLHAYGAIASALYSRQQTGQGQKIDCSLLETQISALANLASNYLVAGKEARRWGTAHESIVPYQAFETSDGSIIIAALNNIQFNALCGKLEIPAIAEDPRFASNPLRVQNRRELIGLLSAEFKRQTTAHWLKQLEGVLACGPINTISQALNDPQVLHRGMVQEVRHSTAGDIRLVGIPVKLSETQPSIRRAPPVLGEHTHEVLASVLGYTSTAIDALVTTGVVGNPHR